MTAELACVGQQWDFYRSDGASAIMRLAHLPDALLPLLQMELLQTQRAIETYDRDELVEFGCYDGRALEVARITDVGYLGIDINAIAVHQLSARIADERMTDRASAHRADFTDRTQWERAPRGHRPLLLLPFHLVGGISDPLAMLRTLASVDNMIAVISVFHQDAATTALRWQYYRACGMPTLTTRHGAHGGPLFEDANGFRSDSFSWRALTDLFDRADLHILDKTTNQVGHCLVIAAT